jgi:endonuclease/exonuclease/phosphatase (EEP) superfamily protein YafD
MNKITGPVVLAGDFNAKHRSWNSHRANKNGNRLLDAALKSTFIVDAPTSPTYLHRFNKYRPDILDIYLTRNV